MSEQTKENEDVDPLDLLAISIHPREGTIDIRNNSTGHTRKLYLSETGGTEWDTKKILASMDLPPYPGLVKSVDNALAILEKRKNQDEC